MVLKNKMISSGISQLDQILGGGVYIGDNVVWYDDVGSLAPVFYQNFIRISQEEGKSLIYLSFDRSNAMIAVVIDTTRIPTYLITKTVQDNSYYVLLPFLCVIAYFGVRTGKTLLLKINQDTFRRVVSVALFAVGVKVLF